VRPDPTHGQVVAILVRGIAPAERAALTTRISVIMSGYAFAYELEWN
jgi:hypothetical protein